MKKFSDLKTDICLGCQLTEATSTGSTSIDPSHNDQLLFGKCTPDRGLIPAIQVLHIYYAYAGVFLSHGKGSNLSIDEMRKQREKFFDAQGKVFLRDTYPSRQIDIECAINALITITDKPLEEIDTDIFKLFIFRSSKIPKFLRRPLGLKYPFNDRNFPYIIFELKDNPQLVRDIVDQYKYDFKNKSSIRGSIPAKAIVAVKESDPNKHNVKYDKAMFAHMLNAMIQSDETYDANRITDPVLQLGMMGTPDGLKWAGLPKIRFSKSVFGTVFIPIRGQWETEKNRVTLNYLQALWGGPGSDTNNINQVAQTLGHEIRHRSFDIIYDTPELMNLMPPELKPGGYWYGSWGKNYNGGTQTTGNNGETAEHAMIYSVDDFDPMATKAKRFFNFYLDKNPDHDVKYFRELYAKVQSGVARYFMSIQGAPKARPTQGIPPHKKLPDISPEEAKMKAEKDVEYYSTKNLLPKLQTDPVVKEMYNRFLKYDGTIAWKFVITTRLDFTRASIDVKLASLSTDALNDSRYKGDLEYQTKISRMGRSMARRLERWTADTAVSGNWWKHKKHAQDMIDLMKITLGNPPYSVPNTNPGGAGYYDGKYVQNVYEALVRAVDTYDEMEKNIKKQHTEGWKYFSYDFIKRDLKQNPDYDPFDADPLALVAPPERNWEWLGDVIGSCRGTISRGNLNPDDKLLYFYFVMTGVYLGLTNDGMTEESIEKRLKFFNQGSGITNTLIRDIGYTGNVDISCIGKSLKKFFSDENNKDKVPFTDDRLNIAKTSSRSKFDILEKITELDDAFIKAMVTQHENDKKMSSSKQPVSSGRGRPATAPPISLPRSLPKISVPAAPPKETYASDRPIQTSFISRFSNRFKNIPTLLRPNRAKVISNTSLTTEEKNLVEKIREIVAEIRKDKPYLGDTALIAAAVLAVFVGGIFAFRKYLFDRKTQGVASQILRDRKSSAMIKDLRRKERRRVIELLKDPKFREKILAEL